MLFAGGSSAYAKDEVRILSITPQTRSPLIAGNTVHFEIEVEFSTSTTEGRALNVSIIRGGHGESSEVLSKWLQPVQGHDRISIQRTVSIPITGTVSVEAGIEDLKWGPKGYRQWAADRKEYDVVDSSGTRIKASGEGDSLKIVTAAPASGTTLKSNETIRFELKVDYELKSSANGRVIWGLSSGGSVQAGGFTEPVKKGKGSLTLSRDVQMRESMGATPAIYVAMYADGYAHRVATDVARYAMNVPAQTASDSPLQLQVDATGKFQDHVRIEAVSPTLETKIKPGDVINLELRIEYELMTFDDAELEIHFHGSQPMGMDNRIVHRGAGSFTVSRKIAISKDAGSEFSVTVILSIPTVGMDKRTWKISP